MDQFGGLCPDIIITDVEGYDFNIFKSLDLSIIGFPSLILMEYTNLTTADQDDARKYFMEFGYRLEFNNSDVLCIHKCFENVAARAIQLIY